MRALRYILLGLIIGLYALSHTSDFSYTEHSAIATETSCQTSSTWEDISADYTKRLKQQLDWSDAITSYQLSSSNLDSRLRTRRHDHTSTSWQLRKYNHQQYAISHHQAAHVSHQINQLVALTQKMPLSLPKEQISFPFHSFW